MTSDPLPDPSPLSRAEELFADWLAEQRGPGARSLEKLCASHPAYAAELRVLERDWKRLQSILRRAGVLPTPLADELRARFGADVDPGISLSGDAPAPDSGPSSELLKRLRAHAPNSTRYKLLGEIGRGGMGAVLRIWDEDLRRTLAMKVVLGKDDVAKGGATPPVDSRVLGRFLEEAQVTGQLDHPGIVPVHELGLDADGRVYFTMRLVKGEDLKRVFEHVVSGHDGWNETRALSVLLKVCEAMSYAHDKGVVHRDLKPGNVMVGKYGEVYVMDWGLARVLGQKDRHDVRLRPEPASSASVRTERREERAETPDSPLVTMDGDVVGTPAYMPPEQARGEVLELGPHSDVYAVGAMLYQLIARQMPFVPPNTRVSAHAVLMRLLEGPPKSLIELAPRAPAELVAICERAMERDVARRYRDMPALAEDLRAYLERRVVKAYETGTWAETKKWVQRNRPLARAVVSAVVIALGACAVVTYKNSQLKAAFATTEAAEGLTSIKNQELVMVNAKLIASDRASRLRGLIPRLAYFETLDDDVYTYAVKQKRPASEWWLEGAHALVDGVTEDAARGLEWQPGLSDVERELEKLRRGALQRTPEDLEDDRRTHPRAGERANVAAELEWYARMLEKRPWPDETDVEAALVKSGWPTDAAGCNRGAWELVDPAKPRAFGRELEAVLIARRAVSTTAEGGPVSACRELYRATLAWAYLRAGRLDAALSEGERAVDEFNRTSHLSELPTEGKTQPDPDLDGSLKRLTVEIARWRGAERTVRSAEMQSLEGRLSELDQVLDEQRTWHFEKSEDEWWHGELVKLAAALRNLSNKIEFVEHSLQGREVEADWLKAIQEITASDKYRGTKWPGGRLTPQIGLVPIGPDPDSGLWEFAHLATGTRARRDAHDHIVVEPEMGLVLVLLPGGWVPKANSEDQLQDATLTTIDLDPYFFSKYEMTQEQWHRIDGWERSDREPRSGLHPTTTLTGMLPATDLSWDDCQTALSRTGWLRLPSEAQWEYGCRASTSTKWWTGDDETQLTDVASMSVEDRSTGRMRIGSLRPNGIGLYDVHGNVAEWCRDSSDRYGGEKKSRRMGDGLWEGQDDDSRVHRGGGFLEHAFFLRSSVQLALPREHRNWSVGLRPARGITP